MTFATAPEAAERMGLVSCRVTKRLAHEDRLLPGSRHQVVGSKREWHRHSRSACSSSPAHLKSGRTRDRRPAPPATHTLGHHAGHQGRPYRSHHRHHIHHQVGTASAKRVGEVVLHAFAEAVVGGDPRHAGCGLVGGVPPAVVGVEQQELGLRTHRSNVTITMIDCSGVCCSEGRFRWVNGAW
jgi:hypothetical protein